MKNSYLRTKNTIGVGSRCGTMQESSRGSIVPACTNGQEGQFPQTIDISNVQEVKDLEGVWPDGVQSILCRNLTDGRMTTKTTMLAWGTMLSHANVVVFVISKILA
jgi:hypothetical protein